MRDIPVPEKYRGIKSDGIIYCGLAKYRGISQVTGQLADKRQLAHCQIAYWSTCGLDKSQTERLADWTTQPGQLAD